jgi:amino acid adenylation domain-containing protein
VQTYQGASVHFCLTEVLTQQLKELALTDGASLYMVILAAYQILLYRYTGQEDTIVGSPTAGRTQSEFAGTIGYFLNPVVLRAVVKGELTFKAFLDQVRQTVLGALDHQDYPFPLLVERLQPNRDPSRSPLFQVAFTYQKPQQFREIVELFAPGDTGVRVNVGGLELEPFEMAQQEGQFDLTLDLIEGQNSLVGTIKYNTDLFEAATITRMVGHFQTLLEGIVANPLQPISELPLLTEAEHHQMLVEWNDTQTEYPQDQCIHQLFEAQVERTPNAIAVVFEDQQLNYATLNQKANQLAHYLQTLGVKPDTFVGICVERSLEMIIGLLGIIKAGGAYVPLEPMYPKERLTFMLSDAQVLVLLTQQKWVDKLPKHDGTVMVCLDTQWGDISQESEQNLVTEVNPENLAYLIYTSGSTGKPKGVQICHQGFVNFLNSMRQKPGLTNQDILLAVTTISFDIAALELYLPLMVGASVTLVSREVASDGLQLLEKLVTSGATAMQATPATWQLLVNAGWEITPNLKILCGGEALSPALASQLLNKGDSVWNLYGPTESTIWSSVYQISHQENTIITKSTSEPIGRPIANTQIYILDHHLHPTPIGVSGELHIGGAGLARGYLNRPELTAEKFIINPFSDQIGSRLYKTGDLVRYRPDGNIEYLGRIDHQVKMRGFRIELGEIESVLVQHWAVREIVVISREYPLGNQNLVAYVVPNQTPVSTSSDEQLRHYLKKKLPDYMVPAFFVMLEAMPMTPNGKVDRCALPAPETSQFINQETPVVSPRLPTEKVLAAIWSELLGRKQVGIHDKFFEIGGTSLLATQLIFQVRDTFSIQLPVSQLFESPTIAGIAKVIDDLIGKKPLIDKKSGSEVLYNEKGDEKMDISENPLDNDDELLKILKRVEMNELDIDEIEQWL